MPSLAEQDYYASERDFSFNSPTHEVAVAEGKRPAILNSRTIDFSGYSDFFMETFQRGTEAEFSVYNPSAAFINPPDRYRAVRVDCLDDDRTKSVIFKHTDDGLEPYPERTFDLEDPFASNFDGEIVFGGVKVNKSRNSKGEVVSNWRTILYRGKTIPELEPFFTGPDGMKDIRIGKGSKGRIGVYTRPRNPWNESLGGLGQIGYREFESLDQLEKAGTASLDIHNAPLLSSFRFPVGEWGGVNHVQVVNNGEYQGWNALLIHKAFRATARHYSAGALLHDPTTGRIIDLGTLVKRSDLPPGPWKGKEKSRDLEDVFFPGELIIEKDKLKVIGGAGDAQVMEVEIPIPLELAA